MARRGRFSLEVRERAVRMVFEHGGGSWPSPRSVASTTATDALPEHRPASSPSLCQPTSRRAKLRDAHKPRRLPKNPASLAALPIHRPIVGHSVCPGLRRDDLVDRHRSSSLRGPV